MCSLDAEYTHAACLITYTLKKFLSVFIVTVDRLTDIEGRTVYIRRGQSTGKYGSLFLFRSFHIN